MSTKLRGVLTNITSLEPVAIKITQRNYIIMLLQSLLRSSYTESTEALDGKQIKLIPELLITIRTTLKILCSLYFSFGSKCVYC
jgi:hypothetical protein